MPRYAIITAAKEFAMSIEILLDIGWRLLAVAVLVFANGFFVASEFSLVGVRRSRIDQLVAEGHPLAPAVRHATQHLDAYLAATQLGITMASLGLGWIGEPAVADLIEPALHQAFGAWAGVGSHTLAFAIAFSSISALHIVLGELAPKSLALQRTESTALWAAKPTHLFLTVFHPIIWALNHAGNLVLRLVGLKPPTPQELVHSVEELKLLVSESEQVGVLEPIEKEMLHQVFEFGDRQAHEVMIPRPAIVGLEAGATVGDLLKAFSQSRHMRFPLFGDSPDNIVGVVVVKDVLLALAQDPTALGRSLKELVRETLFVPESKRVGDLFVEMRAGKTQMAVVLDEYGGTAGIVTLEDLIEEIVGQVSDELVREPLPVRKVDERSHLVNAQLRIDEANAALGLTLPKHPVYETLAGLALYRLRRVPKEGDQFTCHNVRVTVKEMKGPKIEKVLITRL